MMNYLWGGLIALSLAFALWTDASDLAWGKYRNNVPLVVTVNVPEMAAISTPAGGQPVTVDLDPEDYRRHFEEPISKENASGLSAILHGQELRITAPSLPTRLAEMRKHLDEKDKLLTVRIAGLPGGEDPTTAPASLAGKSIRSELHIPPVRFVKIRAITRAAFEFAETAVTIALGLIGVLALWLGLLKIAEASGLVAIFVALVNPVLGLLFPTVPRDHPALGMIALNLAANMLGLGNAATPMGLKAMQELQKLNPSKETATDPMVMLLALNTAGVQLLPSATMLAIMGLSAVNLLFPILVVTGVCAIIAFVSTRLLGRLPVFRKTNPDLMVPMAEVAS